VHGTPLRESELLASTELEMSTRAGWQLVARGGNLCGVSALRLLPILWPCPGL
jgi:hypothetical protein